MTEGGAFVVNTQIMEIQSVLQHDAPLAA